MSCSTVSVWLTSWFQVAGAVVVLASNKGTTARVQEAGKAVTLFGCQRGSFRNYLADVFLDGGSLKSFASCNQLWVIGGTGTGE
jgi:hypothetical protein